ncbi:hypothetical protein Lal_00045975 [Lupinus albus]|nr:hypothetical protein Lal_00045975 [Lupinus albus]
MLLNFIMTEEEIEGWIEKEERKSVIHSLTHSPNSSSEATTLTVKTLKAAISKLRASKNSTSATVVATTKFCFKISCLWEFLKLQKLLYNLLISQVVRQLKQVGVTAESVLGVPNSSPLNMFPKAIYGGGGWAEIGSLDFLRNNPR